MRKIITAAGLSLALALTACGGEEAGTTTLSGEPIENIAPPEGQQWSDVITKTDGGGYMMGNPDAPIKFVEFVSQTCPACASFAEASFVPLRDEYVSTGRVSFELRNFVRNPVDISASMLAECGPDSTFFPLTEQLFAYQPQILASFQEKQDQLAQAQSLPPEQIYGALAQITGLTDFFTARGISKDQAASCLADVEKATQLNNHMLEASEKYQIQGTPSFLINGQRVDNQGWPAIEKRLQEMGAR